MKRWWTARAGPSVVMICLISVLFVACDEPPTSTPTSSSPIFLCSAWSDMCSSDSDCPSGRCNTITCNCCPADSDLCTSDADCGTNQFCDTTSCNCRCGTGSVNQCYGDLPGVGNCQPTMIDIYGAPTSIYIHGICDETCQCCECLTDADCVSPYKYCNPETCFCELRPECSTCDPPCTPGETSCMELASGCECVPPLSTIDLYGCFPAIGLEPGTECANGQGSPRRAWPGDPCMTPTGFQGVCDETCDCVVDVCPTPGGGRCSGKSDGDTCTAIDWTGGIAGVCQDCRCVCAEGTACAGLLEGAACTINGITGQCDDCVCEICPPESPCYDSHPGSACTTDTGSIGKCYNCVCKEPCPEDSPCHNVAENVVCTTENGLQGRCQDCECVACENQALACYNQSNCGIDSYGRPTANCIGCLCCPTNSDRCNSGTDCFSGACNIETCDCCPLDSDLCSIDADCGSPLLYCNANCDCVPMPLHICSAVSDGCVSDDDCGPLLYCNYASCNCVPLPVRICSVLSDGCISDDDCPSGYYCTWNCNCLPNPAPVPPQPSPPDDTDLCANNGGIQWEGEICACSGYVDRVTICNDGTKIDQVTDQPCSPDPAACTDQDKGDESTDDEDNCTTRDCS